MRRNILTLPFVFACALCPAASFAEVVLVKCSDAGGAITYMTNQCEEDMSQLETISESEPAAMTVKTIRRANTRTRWAEPVVYANKRPDVELMRAAKMNAELMDAERHKRIFQQASID
tara:strand:- start:283331 stop:283684 length:354 start_codon:yes stop_codon:yes gene_type:complete